MPNNNETLSALVVGAGPIGLTMALALTLRGIKCRIIDKSPVASDKSKALGIHARTLELLETMGIVDDFLAVGHKVHATNICNGETTLVHLCFDEMEGHYPYALMVPQSVSEKLLTEQLEKHSIKIERELELTNFTQDQDSVTATLKRADGSTEEVKANWLLGCDGAHSTIRHILGFKFDGATYDEAFATADCYINWDKPEDELFGFVCDEGSAFFFPLGNKRYRIVADGPMPKTGAPLLLEEMQALIDKRVPGNFTLSNPNWLTWFTISRRSVSEYRNGRVFISGDAAHIHSPMMGQGMNTGMHDALNLAWKLELVEKGEAKSDLLDTYQSERHPVGQSLLKNTDAVTKVVTLRNHIGQEVRNRLMPLLASHDVVKQRAWRTLSMLGVNYRSSPLVGEYRASLSHAMNHPISNLNAWFDFSHGPSAGDRAPDGALHKEGTDEPVRLFEQFRNIAHNLVFFVGLHDDEESFSTIDKTIEEIEENYGEFIKCHVVVSNPDEATKLKSTDSILIDKDGALHHRYGAAHSCLYLIRPDGYVGFRSQPIEIERLQKHLDKIFSLRPAKCAATK